MITKRALIRDNDAPIGQPGSMYLVCCGGRLYVSRVGRMAHNARQVRCPACLALYDTSGYVMVPGMTGETADA